ncbi:proteasome regulatory particle base subunit rpn10 [Microbotryomycetes sp. JL221]|nr:proteasome regulatory particle base subunit rpn10 [Microbotryomycetes sp. JL221]
MSLEATMLVLDNSSSSINGDYTPTRLEAQIDAVHVIFNQKLRAHPENEVGLIVMGGKAEVLVTPTQDEGKLIHALHNTKQGGEADLSTGIQVAQLALKHRQNKNQRQRIIVFVASPLSITASALVKLGKKMKKNNVAIDIVSFGTDTTAVDLTIPGTSSSTTTPVTPETNEQKLTALHEAVNSSDNSHYLFVEPGPHLLSERINNSPILRGQGQGGDGDMGGMGGEAAEFGVDPNLDPELAMALRMSLEEERARQAASSGTASGSSAPALDTVAEGTTTTTTGDATATTQDTSATATSTTDNTSVFKTESTDDTAAALAAAAAAVRPDDASASLDVAAAVSGGGEDQQMQEDEDDELARALALSRGEDVEMNDDDEDMARAIAMSMQQDEQGNKEDKKE